MLSMGLSPTLYVFLLPFTHLMHAWKVSYVLREIIAVAAPHAFALKTWLSLIYPYMLLSIIGAVTYSKPARQAGYFIPLSGGIDSCATSVIIHSMCRLVHQAIETGDNPLVIADLRRIAGEEDDSTWTPSSPQEIAGRIFHTAFMGMEKNSSPDTRQRARDLGAAIGSYHLNFDIDTVVSAVISLFTTVTRFTPRYKMHECPIPLYP